MIEMFCLGFLVAAAIAMGVFTAPLEMHRPPKARLSDDEISHIAKCMAERFIEWNINERSDGEPLGLKPNGFRDTSGFVTDSEDR